MVNGITMTILISMVTLKILNDIFCIIYGVANRVVK